MGTNEKKSRSGAGTPKRQTKQNPLAVENPVPLIDCNTGSARGQERLSKWQKDNRDYAMVLRTFEGSPFRLQCEHERFRRMLQEWIGL